MTPEQRQIKKEVMREALAELWVRLFPNTPMPPDEVFDQWNSGNNMAVIIYAFMRADSKYISQRGQMSTVWLTKYISSVSNSRRRFLNLTKEAQQQQQIYERQQHQQDRFEVTVRKIPA